MGRGKSSKSRSVGGQRRVARLPCGKVIKEPVQRIKSFIQVHQKRCDVCAGMDLSSMWKSPVKDPSHADFRGGMNEYGGGGGNTMTALDTETGEEVEMCRPVGMSPEEVYEGMKSVTFKTMDEMEELSQKDDVEVTSFDGITPELLEQLGMTEDELIEKLQDKQEAEIEESPFTMEFFKLMTTKLDREWIMINNLTIKKKRSKERNKFIGMLAEMIVLCETHQDQCDEGVMDAWIKFSSAFMTTLDYIKTKAMVVMEFYLGLDKTERARTPAMMKYCELVIPFVDAVKCCNSVKATELGPQLKEAVSGFFEETETVVEAGGISEGQYLAMSKMLKNQMEMVNACSGRSSRQLDAINKDLRSDCWKLF